MARFDGARRWFVGGISVCSVVATACGGSSNPAEGGSEAKSQSALALSAGGASPTSATPVASAAPATPATAVATRAATSPAATATTRATAHPAATATRAASATLPGATTSAARADCSPSYPTLCLRVSPDLNCPDIPEKNFPVLAPDPHKLDSDKDGIGCESAN